MLLYDWIYELLRNNALHQNRWNINLLVHFTITNVYLIYSCDILTLLNTKRLSFLFINLNQQLSLTLTLYLFDNANLIHLYLLYFLRHIWLLLIQIDVRFEHWRYLFPYLFTLLLCSLLHSCKMVNNNQCLIRQQIQIMKVSASKMAAPNSKTKNNIEKSECTTGVVSRQRSHAQSLIRLKDQRIIGTGSQKEQEKFMKTKQLFHIIETFYSTLCDLPLDKLVNSEEPEAWIAQQEETLATLQSKLRTIGKEKDQQYYRWKLKSVSNILGNIRENLTMLHRMSQLKNYCSGTESSNYRSNRESSVDSSKIKLGQFASENGSIKEMLNYDQYHIETSQVPKSDTSKYPQIMAHTVNSEIESQEEETFTRSQIFPRPNVKRRVPRQGENRNTSNKAQFVDKSSKSNHSNDIKDKTLTKVHVLPSKSQATINNLSTEHRFNNKGFNLLSNEETKRSQIMEEDDSYKPQTQTNEYLELIKELKLQMMQKDKQIDRLLIEQQQFDETIQLLQQREKEKNTEILFLKENALSNDRQRERLHSQIRRLNNETEDLRETVRLQRQRYRKEQREKDKVQVKLTEQAQSKQQLVQEITQLRQQNKQLKKGERQMKEKLQIYTRKYFTLYGTSETLKEQMRKLTEELAKERQRTKAESRYEVVKKIIGHHKERLCSQDFSS